MNIIFNLVLFLLVISILLVICNNLSKDEIKLKKYKSKKEVKKEPTNIPPAIFDYEKGNYETVPENTKKFNLEQKYNDDQKYAAQMVPKYEPHKNEENKEFYNKKHSDQPIIYDNRMYEKPIHRDREVVQDLQKNLPTKISDLFDNSITDFKTLVPKMKGTMGTMISDGAYNPDFIHYEDEKPENGGVIPKLYNGVFGNDPLLETNCAKF